MYDTPRTIDEVLTMLAIAPERILDLTKGLSAVELLALPQPSEWSARDVLAHLCACSDMWGKYITEILNEDKPTFNAVSPSAWIRHTDYLQEEFLTLFQAYATQRAELLAVLKTLTPESWSRSATVITAGKPRQRTVYTYAQWLANHEQSHYRQIGQIGLAVRMLS